MERVIVLMEEYSVDLDTRHNITVFSDWDKAQKEFDKLTKADAEMYPDTIQTWTETYYENHVDGEFAETHALIYLTEKEVQ